MADLMLHWGRSGFVLGPIFAFGTILSLTNRQAVKFRTEKWLSRPFFPRFGWIDIFIKCRVPLLYMHSPVETASLSDVENLIKLMAETVLAMEADQVFEV